MTGACRCGRDSIPGTTRTSCHEWRHCAKARCDSCPLLDRPARVLRITINPLCRWCRPSLTEETGPPLPPPEPLPDVSTATPCRPASDGLTSSCSSCSRVRTSVHNMRAHARRARPGVPIVGEGLTCGCHNGASVFLTGASRTGRHRKCQACQQAKHAGSTSAGTRDGPRETSLHPLQKCPRRWELGMRVFGVPQPARRHDSDGMLDTFVRTALALLTFYYNGIQQK
ncbi:hypothetical protein TcCL_ESM11475 [Trypanosoma cruzi]|nr:hypothetical protein TcCL_ESM11475 [Trypanosoma cruzi]